MDNNNDLEIEKTLILRTMNSVDNLTVQVAELNTTLKENVLSDIQQLKARGNRHREDIDKQEKRIKTLETHRKYVIITLSLLGTAITSVVLPILLALL